MAAASMSTPAAGTATTSDSSPNQQFNTGGSDQQLSEASQSSPTVTPVQPANHNPGGGDQPPESAAAQIVEQGPPVTTKGDGEGETAGTGEQSSAIEVIYKPKGEAGSCRRRYNLQEAMRMSEDKKYQAFLRSVRQSAVHAGIKYHCTYCQQDLEVINNVCKLVVKNNPYLTKK
ncbi:hypothetical protein AAF712_016283 [Marasmius tenuissimus]|uniref:Uncharacterized protein n=1 Tax=Marasmius tenuissimus TaxID=585030 RepID=A0ABR2Z641_9AGAR|nr:hypothetical protein PM082_024850 [Marasmius tenuissimus]